MPCSWHVWYHVRGMFCGLNWEDNVAGGQELFRDGFGSKTGVYRSAKELFGTPGHGSHAIAWLGASSGTLWRRIPRYSVAPAQCKPSNFG